MKRYIILLGVLLCCIMLKAQSVTYTCRYWFDQNHTQAVTATFNDSTWQTELDIGSLTEGIHKLRLQVADTSMKWSSPLTYLFFKTADTLQENMACCYWFDQNHAQMQQLPFGNGNLLLNVSDLEDGLHTVNILLEGENLTTTQRFSFVKVAVVGLDTLDMSNLMYHCWFDQDFEHRQTDSVGDGHFLLDVSELTDGLHTVNVLLEGDALSSITSYMFMKVAVQDPTAETRYRCWFDNDFSTMQTGSVGTSIFELEVGGLSNGIHTVYVQLVNGTPSAPQYYMFYKRPVDGYISKWEYWLNGDTNNKHSTELSPYVDTLDIVTLLPLETWPIRSSCFHFQPNGDEPFINAKNEITFRFWDVDKHFLDKSTFYVDGNVSEPIVADTIERNTTVIMDAPRDNQIHWFKMEVGRGDYMSFQASKACTMQLFAPSGEEVYTASGPESILMNGTNVWENGIYYLAVHDVTGSGEMVSITYNWLNRYTVASYDVHLVGNGGCSTITFQGNGFNSLLDAYLVNWQNDTIRSLDIGHESNTTTTVSLNFYQENLGAYDAVFEFFEETIRINGALEVQEPVDILLTSSVSYPSRFLRNTPCTYTYTITNNGNMYAYAVPIFVYIASPTLDGISHIEFDGLDLPSIIDDIDLDSLTLPLNEIMEIKAWAESFGDDHYFIKTAGVDEATGDSVVVRSNFFFLNLAPFETKTLTLKITSNEPVDVWMTVPNDTISPVNFIETRYSVHEYCCVADRYSCVFGIVCSALDVWSLFTGPWITVPACVCSLLNSLMTEVNQFMCSGGGSFDGFFNQWRTISVLRSAFSAILSCMIHKGLFNVFRYKEIINEISKALTALTIGDSPLLLHDCIHAFSDPKPGCPIGAFPQGGLSTPVYSLDPNDIHGYLSESGSHYMRQEIQNVQYEIEFENDTTLATAAAHTIIVRDTLDAAKFDLNSLAARSVTIGDKRLDLNGEQTFARTLDLRPENYVIAQVEQDYDAATGIIQWTIQSLDPMTMEPTDDPNQGVLPVNYFGDGVGFIDYSIDIKEAFADGTEISNRAGIIFDQEGQILTPTWTNIVDAVKPTSHIEEVTPIADSLNFQFVSSDNRSGVWYHTLYYRNDSTEMEWQVRKPQILGNEFMLPIDSLLTTEFLVMAIDSAGNHEEKEMVAEYTYFSTIPTIVTQSTVLTEGWNWYSTYIEQEGIDGLTMLENSLGTNGIRIQSKNDGAVDQFEYNGNNYWYGSLNELTNEQMYKVRTNAVCNVAMSGYLARMENHPITLNEGWNWISFPIGQSLSLETAMSGFTPESDDIIKGRTASATFVSFDNYSMWYGTLNALEPGQGYMYKSNSSSPKTLVFQSGRSWKAAAPTTHEGTAFTSNTAAFADNMLVTAVIELGGHELRSEDYELAAFVDNECRGSVKLMYVEPLDRYVAFLLAFGEATETMHFVLTDGTDVVWSDDNLSYIADGTIGTLSEPVTLHFGTMGLNDNGAEYVNVFPNPSRGVFNIEGKGIRRIEVIDGYGQVLRSEEVKNDYLQINLSDRAAGAYLLRVVTDKGVTSKKLVLVR